MQPIQIVEVVPCLPEKLECLRELAYNLRWTWEHEVIDLFARLDRELWDKTEHNPVLMLGLISQERLIELSGDEGFCAHLQHICEKHHQYLDEKNTWWNKHYPGIPENSIAYFSAEFGLSACLPIYSGGLGVLAGDHIKAASDLGLPLVAVGIVYQHGYFRQYLNPDGWQQQRYPINDFYNLPITLVKDADGNRITVPVELPGRQVHVAIWKAQVGRVSLYLLDTNIPENSQQDEDITDQLYHGDKEMRIQQELVLGIGGMRALNALGINPGVCHMNEGHSAFMALERIAMLMKENGLSFGEARQASAAGQIFTTHTAVPAGIDKFPPDLVDRYLEPYYSRLGIGKEEFLSLGRDGRNGEDEPFSMANLAIKLSSKTNAVSALHGEVSRKLFGPLWKNVPEHEVPITHITNGIHTRSWISQEMSDLYDRYLGTRWSEETSDLNVWRRVADIPDTELWRTHERRRESLVAFCRNRLGEQLENRGALLSEIKMASEILDSEALTIGFARRFATYKRATLLLKDAERLKSILSDSEKPVQIIIAGKAHPEDAPAKELIRQLVHFARDADVRNRLVFLEDYDMNVARYLVTGVDVWLNTPRRFLEACGTSGMKVAFNGGINVSILDGWWDEAYDAKAGWAIGHGEVYDDPDYQDTVESNALYDLLEKEIIPLFYDRVDGRPQAWIDRMKTAMLEICPMFNVNRMVRDYATRAYFPAETRYREFMTGKAERASGLAAWRDKVLSSWDAVKILKVEAANISKLQVGDDMRVSVDTDLAGLSPGDVSAQIYHGPVDAHGNIVSGQVAPMSLNGSAEEGVSSFSGAIRYFQSGRHGFTVRLIPHHDDLSSPFETGLIHWA